MRGHDSVIMVSWENRFPADVWWHGAQSEFPIKHRIVSSYNPTQVDNESTYKKICILDLGFRCHQIGGSSGVFTHIGGRFGCRRCL